MTPDEIEAAVAELRQHYLKHRDMSDSANAVKRIRGHWAAQEETNTIFDYIDLLEAERDALRRSVEEIISAPRRMR